MASPASPASSTSSIGSRRSLGQDNSHDLTLEDLVNHFVAAKRSLNTQTVLWRATEIVSSARELLQENAVLAAKNAAIRNMVDQQVDALEAIRIGIDVVDNEVQVEYKQLLHDVDTSFAGLNSTLSVLRNTPIEAVLQPPGAAQKHLYDFIDSSAVSNLESNLRSCIDRFNDSHATLEDSTDAFDTALANLHSSIANVPSAPTTASSASPIPTLYRDLEIHAKEAAQVFQSLVSHYDLCVTALRHTDGGSAAATLATGDTTLSPTAHPDPLSASSRREMLSVLSTDAREVESAATEIRSRGAEMTFLLSQITSHIAQLRHEQSALRSILTMLSHLAHDARSHTATARAFHAAFHSDTRAALVQGAEEWEAQRDFYERFDLAYAELLVEISARRRRHDKAKRRAEEAQRELDRLWGEDGKARDAFTRAQGDFLPLDIWRGLRDAPRRWEVRIAEEVEGMEEGQGAEEGVEEGGENAEGGGQGATEKLARSIPVLDRTVVERALTRTKRRM